MPIGLEDKRKIVAEVNETASKALSAVMADYHGVDVSDMTELRAKARAEGVELRVIRNTLAKRAFEGTELECLTDQLLGPNILGFSMEDPGAVARVFKDFAKENEAFEIKALSVGGKALPAAADGSHARSGHQARPYVQRRAGSGDSGDGSRQRSEAGSSLKRLRQLNPLNRDQHWGA